MGQNGPRRSHSLQVTFLGAVVRRLGEWMPIAGTVDLMRELGLEPSSVRTSVARLKTKGWLLPEQRGGVRGYSLTQTALDALVAGDEVIWHARQTADMRDGWCIINFSVPEADRSKRYQLRAHLASLGFGNLGAGVWIAPSRMRTAGEQAIAACGLTDQSYVFVGQYVGGQEISRVVELGWDLADLGRRYREFIGEHKADAARLAVGPVTGGEAFSTYITAVDHWRRLPFRDPGLPAEFLASDWPGPEAVSMFEGLVQLLEGRALAHAARHWPEVS